MLDDDYASFEYRFIKDGSKLGVKQLNGQQVERFFSEMLNLLDSTGAAIVAFAQGGDQIGGIKSKKFHSMFIRKCMNSMFCRTDRPLSFMGTMNEDITTYTTLGSRGVLFLTYTHLIIRQLETQSLAGGMTEAYRESGTYKKSFYSVLSMPSCVKIAMMNTNHSRIHSNVFWNNCVPKIIDEKWRREA
jgi:hypothetical protein